MANITRWWWVSAAPIYTSGIYVGTQDEAPIDVDESVYELFGSIIPSPSLVCSSPLKRALGSAEKLHKLKGVEAPISQIDGLGEQDFGLWEGKTFADVQAIVENDPNAAPENIADLKPEGGESFAELIKRADLTIDAIGYQLEENRQDTMADVVCVSHISIIRAAISKAMGLSAKQSLQIHLQPLSLTVLEHHEHFGWFVHTTGWTPWPMAR